MVAEDPGPDNDTMETLIETNEALSKAMNQHQRAVLHARKLLGLGNGETGNTPPGRIDSGFAAPPGPPPGRTESGFAAPPGPPPILSKPVPVRKAVTKAPQIPPPGDYAPTGSDDENPFSDPSEQPVAKKAPPFLHDRPSEASDQFNDRLGIEPYHPGFRETRSYVGRQDSSVGKVTMHSAVPDTPDVDDEEVGSRANAPVGYGIQPGRKAPVYRY
jgi:hypothetical protein